LFHLDLPLTVSSNGSLGTVAADSAKDVANSVGMLVATRVGERLSVPDYGLPDPLFSGADSSVVEATVGAWEPRADPAAVEVSVNPDGSVAVTMNSGG
jgi:phage baseplate assembly protein W